MSSASHNFLSFFLRRGWTCFPKTTLCPSIAQKDPVCDASFLARFLTMKQFSIFSQNEESERMFH